MMKKIFFLFFAVLTMVACRQQSADNSAFVRVENGHFVRDGKPYYYVGTNFWYGAILGSEGQAELMCSIRSHRACKLTIYARRFMRNRVPASFTISSKLSSNRTN